MELQILFEMLCKKIESGEVFPRFHFKGACGVDTPMGVFMAFVFSEAVLVFCVPLKSLFEDRINDIFSVPSLSIDECLDMTKDLESFNGGFRSLFNYHD